MGHFKFSVNKSLVEHVFAYCSNFCTVHFKFVFCFTILVLISVCRNAASANLYNDAARNRREINLQGYDVNAAMQRLKEVISGLQYSTWQTCQPQLLLIKLGASAAGLLYAILHLLEDAKLHWFEAETGILEVLIS